MVSTPVERLPPLLLLLLLCRSLMGPVWSWRTLFSHDVHENSTYNEPLQTSYSRRAPALNSTKRAQPHAVAQDTGVGLLLLLLVLLLLLLLCLLFFSPVLF